VRVAIQLIGFPYDRGMITFLGLFFPVFYLQLDAISHGIGAKLALYSVSTIFLLYN
jgi:hypothetical protein